MIEIPYFIAALISFTLAMNLVAMYFNMAEDLELTRDLFAGNFFAAAIILDALSSIIGLTFITYRFFT